MAQLDCFGHDARTLLVKDHYAVGFQSHWVVPEEVNERQPLFDETSNTWFMLHGRIDNRSVLLDDLAVSASQAMTDAQLLHAYVLAFGEARLNRVIGSFAFVLFDVTRETILAARDPMGGRQLVYRVTTEHILISTFEMALVAHPTIEYRFSDAKVARRLVQLMEEQPSCLIERLTILKPGDTLRVDKALAVVRRYYRFNAKKNISLTDDDAYAAEFRRLLDQAVQRRLRSVGAIGTMLSGGMDSVPLSILAAQALSNQKNEQRHQQSLTAFSWVFDEHSASDEREYSVDISVRFGIKQVMVHCDNLWLQYDHDTFNHPLVPFANPYSEFQQQTFRQAQDDGVKTLLTGIHGDLLYGYTQGVFIELLKSGRWREAGNEFARAWNVVSDKWVFIKRYVIAQLPLMRKLLERRRLRTNLVNGCLQDNIAAQLHNQRHWLWSESQSALRPLQYQIVLGEFAGEDLALGSYMEAKFGIDRRFPFRDRNLCEFMLAIPSDQLYFKLIKRPIVKNAFSAEFGPKLTARNSKTDFTNVIAAGVQNDVKNRDWFNADPSEWQYYVKAAYFDDESVKITERDTLRWNCGYYNYWKSVCYNSILDELGAFCDE